MFLGRDGFVWWIGVVEDNEDPLLLCRVKVRIFGYHPKFSGQTTTTGDTGNLVPTGDLPWATVMISPNTATLYSRIDLGEFVIGFFLDGVEAQEPVVFGVIPTPLKAGAPSNKFGKHAKSTRSFNALTTSSIDYPPGGANNVDYQKLAQTKVIRSESGHAIALLDHPDLNEILIFHKDGFSVSLNKDRIRLAHGSSATNVILTKDTIELKGKGSSKLTLNADDITVEGSLGSYNLIDQLDWISKNTHTTTGGGKRGPRNFTIGTRANPGPSGGGGGGGGGCFTGETFVTMWDGTKKRIDEIQVGDLVQSGIATQSSKVLFVEKLPDNILWKELYSPSGMHEPFATPNHMLFVNREWVALDINKYDWMPKTKMVNNPITRKTEGGWVYNLWLDGGDGTYYVNDYVTHSIMYNGGFVRLAWEKEYLTHDQVMALMFEFTSQDRNLTYGSYIINKLVGKINQKHWIKLISYIMKKEKDYFPRKAIVFSMKVASTIMRSFNKIKEILWQEK